MTKRILMMITILLLLCGLTAGAEGTEDVHNALSGAVEDLLYRIVLRTETGDKTMGSGVLFMDKNVLLTAAGCCRDGELYAVGKDGEQRITACDILSDSGAALLEMAAPAAAEPLTLAGYSSAGVTYIFGVDASGKQKIVPLERIGRGMYHEQETLQLSGEEGLLPGAVVLDAQGQLLCMVIAQQAEGRGMYTALAADVLYSALTGEKDADAFLPAEAKWAAGKLSVSWKDEERTEGVYLVTISGGENNYYTSNEVKADQRSIELPVPPGHTYFVQVQWVEDASQAIKPVWSAMTAIEVSAEPFTRYTYTQECHLASAPAGQNVTSALPPMEDITVAALGDKQRDIYLQVRNAYDVSEKERLLMTVELIAADGQFYYLDLGFTFSPEHEMQDGIAVPVDSLFAGSAQFAGGSLQPGGYTLRYAFEGQVAGEYTFTVSPGGEVPEQTRGFANGVKAETDKGLVTLSWDGASIPDGAKVNAYYFYEGNSYYIYHEMEPGETSTELYTVPGRRMMAWVVWSTDGKNPELVPQRAQELTSIEAPESVLMTMNGFTNLRLSVVASRDADAVAKGQYLPESPITRVQLADEQMHFYFQTEDIYQIEENSTDHPLAVVLCTPDGQCFISASIYTFDRSLQNSDLWLMDITKLFRDHAAMTGSKAWPSGEYTVLYCIDGKLAGEYVFTLE